MSKTKAQLKTLWDELDELLDDFETHLDGELTTNLDAVSAAIDAGSDEPEDAEIRGKLDSAWKAAEQFWSALAAMHAVLPKYVGRYAGCADLSNAAKCWAAFHDKITAESEAVESRGLTKFSSMVAGGPVNVTNLVGNRTVSQINALSPTANDSYVVTDAGTLTAGSLAVAAGDLVTYSGSAWAIAVANSGGYVPAGTKAILATEPALVSPYTDSTDDGKVVRFSGASNTGTDVSNRGNGTFCVLNTDPQGLQLDISHVETLTLRCTAAEGSGAQAGSEVFSIEGASGATRNWKDGGSGRGGQYAPTQGLAVNGASADQKPASGTIVSLDGASQLNLVQNGSFESTFSSGTGIVPNWVTAEYAVLSAETTLVVKGSQSLKATGNFTIYNLLKARVGALRAYALEAWVYVHASMTAGTLTFKVKDDDTTHSSFTITCDTTTLANATWTKLPYTAAWLPRTIGKNLRVEIELTGYAGSQYVLVDEVKLIPLLLLDGGRAVGVMGGSRNWQLNDCATGATTSANTGTRQERLNRHHKVAIRHAGSATYWTDGV